MTEKTYTMCPHCTCSLWGNPKRALRRHILESEKCRLKQRYAHLQEAGWVMCGGMTAIAQYFYRVTGSPVHVNPTHASILQRVKAAKDGRILWVPPWYLQIWRSSEKPVSLWPLKQFDSRFEEIWGANDSSRIMAPEINEFSSAVLRALESRRRRLALSTSLRMCGITGVRGLYEDLYSTKDGVSE